MKNRNINRLLRQMKRLSVDVNDTEVGRKFEILIKSGDEVDISSKLLSEILADPLDVEEKELPELYLLYFRHYRFLWKRQKKTEAANLKKSKTTLSNTTMKKSSSGKKRPVK